MSTTNSINTNTAAAAALEQLNSTRIQLAQTQQAVTTGLRVSGPQDDASSFAIALNLKGTIAGDTAVQTALSTGESAVNVAVNAGQSIADLLTQAKAKIVEANQSGLDATSRTALHNDFAALRSQINTIVATASFNGTNLIDSGATTLNVLSTADGSVIAVSAQGLTSSALGISSADLTTSGSATAALTAINTAITTVANALAALGSAVSRIEDQSTFTGKLIDTLNAGVGDLVDADLAQESAQLQALQIKQQLGVQALSIANQTPQSLLSLFR
ncbi:MAG TPA: flagellin [Candidatus Sulfotelmatobacter sp.]|nr:flagellin [Candidatus Sulfotelmatobacter sp.]